MLVSVLSVRARLLVPSGGGRDICRLNNIKVVRPMRYRQPAQSADKTNPAGEQSGSRIFANLFHAGDTGYTSGCFPGINTLGIILGANNRDAMRRRRLRGSGRAS
jgi:hypothetical protein